MVEQVRHFFGQLEIAQIRVGAFQKPGQRGERLILPHQFRQQPVQPPHQPALVERRLLRHFTVRQHRPVGLPDETGREQEVHAGSNAQPALDTVIRALLRQRQLQPLGNAVTLYQEGFALQRRHGVLPADVHHGTAQVFQVVGVDGVKAGFDGACLGHTCSFGVRVNVATTE